MFIEILKFFIYSMLIVLISKYILVNTLRKLAESLNLKAKTVGDVAGYATSIPEFLTITISSIRGLVDASIYNVLSSNIINLLQYIYAIILNKNVEKLRNRAIIIDLTIVLITIAIPLFFLIYKIDLNLSVTPLFIVLFLVFRYINNNAHKLYLQKQDKELEKEVEEEQKWERENKVKIFKYCFYLAFSGLVLFVIGELLGQTLQNLCDRFNISEIIIGILLL